MNANVRDVAARCGFSESAASAALEALQHGGGMAQFDHPELGGYGQWMGGMVMIGAMSDDALKARVAALFSDLLTFDGECQTESDEMEPMKPMRPMSPMKPMTPMTPMKRSHFDAPASWGEPASTGGQNSVRYAYFPAVGRLIVEEGANRTVYDTADHTITGVAQDQSDLRTGRLVFTSQHGPVAIESLRVIKE